MNDCRNKRGLNDSFAEFDSTEDEKKILRVPQEYVLRVLNGGGALIREHCEIECSRAVLAASPGKSYSSLFNHSDHFSCPIFSSSSPFLLFFFVFSFNLPYLISDSLTFLILSYCL